MNIYGKQYLLSLYKAEEIKTDLFNEESLVLKELLFSESTQEPTLLNLPSGKYYNNYFTIDDNHALRVKKGDMTTSSRYNNGGYYRQALDRIDTPNGQRFNHKKKEITINKEANFSIDSVLGVNKNNNLEFIGYDHFHYSRNKLVFNVEATAFNTNMLKLINSFLEYPYKTELWYVYQSLGNTIYGPISSSKLCDLYNSGVVNGTTEVRLIDCFRITDVKMFKFFKLKEVENKQFVDRVFFSEMYDFNSKFKIENNTNGYNDNDDLFHNCLKSGENQSKLRENGRNIEKVRKVNIDSQNSTNQKKVIRNDESVKLDSISNSEDIKISEFNDFSNIKLNQKQKNRNENNQITYEETNQNNSKKDDYNSNKANKLRDSNSNEKITDIAEKESRKLPETNSHDKIPIQNPNVRDYYSKTINIDNLFDIKIVNKVNSNNERRDRKNDTSDNHISSSVYKDSKFTYNSTRTIAYDCSNGEVIDWVPQCIRF
jgi:hypothetical protein